MVLPAARTTLAGQHQIFLDRRKAAPPSAKTIASVSEWYVRCTDRYIEILGRRSPEHGRDSGMLRPKAGQLAWNDGELATGAKQVTQMITDRIGRSGHTVKVVTADFGDLTAAEFETFALWVTQDEPPPAH